MSLGTAAGPRCGRGRAPRRPRRAAARPPSSARRLRRPAVRQLAADTWWTSSQPSSTRSGGGPAPIFRLSPLELAERHEPVAVQPGQRGHVALRFLGATYRVPVERRGRVPGAPLAPCAGELAHGALRPDRRRSLPRRSLKPPTVAGHPSSCGPSRELRLRRLRTAENPGRAVQRRRHARFLKGTASRRPAAGPDGLPLESLRAPPGLPFTFRWSEVKHKEPAP